MSRPLRLEFPGAVWHLYNRGVNRQNIVFDEVDRRIFLAIVARTVRRYGWLLHAWVQMTNHYHLLVETPQTHLSAGMHDLDGDFAQAVNRRHGRVGHLFPSRFRDALVQKESHRVELIRYVVLNPVRARLVETPEAWEWSSYRRAGIRLRDLTEILGVRYSMVSKLVAAGRRLGQTPWGKKCMADIQIRLLADSEGLDRK